MSDPLLFQILNTYELREYLGYNLNSVLPSPGYLEPGYEEPPENIKKNFRLYVAGDVPQSTDKPYATFQLISDVPDNDLKNNACSSRYTMQIDVWADTQSQSRAIAALIKKTLRAHAYMVYRMEDFDVLTNLKRASQTFDFMINPN